MGTENDIRTREERIAILENECDRAFEDFQSLLKNRLNPESSEENQVVRRRSLKARLIETVFVLVAIIFLLMGMHSRSLLLFLIPTFVLLSIYCLLPDKWTESVQSKNNSY